MLVLKAWNVVQKLSVLRSIILDVGRDTYVPQTRRRYLKSQALRTFPGPRVLELACFPPYLQDADTDENQGSLGFEEFCSFYKMISTRRDLYLIMISYSNQKEVMDLHDLARFLEIEQKVRTELLQGGYLGGLSLPERGGRKNSEKRNEVKDIFFPLYFFFFYFIPVQSIKTKLAADAGRNGSGMCRSAHPTQRLRARLRGDCCVSNQTWCNFKSLNAAALEKRKKNTACPI